jgi:hypothetical protein
MTLQSVRREPFSSPRPTRTRRLTAPAVLVAAVTTILAAGAVQPAAQQRETRERHIYASVTGNDEQPITGLTAKDFVVREDDVAREVLRVGEAPPPTHIALLLDDTEVARPVIQEIRNSALAFVRAVMKSSPAPQVALITFGERPTRVVNYANAAGPLEQQINRVFSRPGSGSYLMQALVEEAAVLRKAEAARPVVVALVVESGPEFSNETHQRVEEALKATGASLWTVVLQDRTGNLNDTDARERAIVLGDSTTASGGRNRVVLSRQGLESAMTKLAAELAARYDITYGRPDSLVPPQKLKLEVKREGARLAAPSWPGK